VTEAIGGTTTKTVAADADDWILGNSTHSIRLHKPDFVGLTSLFRAIDPLNLY